MNHTASQASSAYVKASFQSKATKQQSSNLGKYNYYQVLELPNFASIEQVKLAYRDLAKRWHPDFHLEN
ncbi:MAG: J domain-containing protein, partial [Candidatus Melainabacteria bacterium]|nr:J domain-containing protein [Candidatus Melainabacteria bacterium]